MRHPVVDFPFLNLGFLCRILRVLRCYYVVIMYHTQVQILKLVMSLWCHCIVRHCDDSVVCLWCYLRNAWLDEAGPGWDNDVRHLFVCRVERPDLVVQRVPHQVELVSVVHTVLGQPWQQNISVLRLCIGFVFLAIYWSLESFNDWKQNPVLTSVKTTGN